MARNRKNQSATVRFGPALKALLICLLIGGSGVGYVWQQNQLFDLGRQKAECEKRLNTLRAQNGQLARHLAELQSPRSEEHTSELQSPCNLVCRLLLEKKNTVVGLPYPARDHRD